MTMCPDNETLLWADIHGELSPSERNAWKNHLSTCLSCSKAKIEAIEQLGIIKEAITPPAPSEKALDTAVRRIASKTIRANTPRQEEKHGWSSPAIWAPAAACVCLIVLSIWFFNLNPKKTVPTPVAAVSVHKIKPVIQKEDLDVIRNLELLREFEAIQRLVQIVDHTKAPQSSPAKPEPLQGKIPGGEKTIYG